ncbi:YopX family protein [Neomoorella thermoacetica]|uniref:YopX family protein n=1 Tax=Neomoorella thermoacetica TaxID=1525 RepID=UPI0008FB059C|nr:YopX family protein [Moorella thermoacetica]OIQ53424.1 YopX protein [Moorella thermoacetica]
MREIKFRAWEKWDDESAEMVYFDIYSPKAIEELATNAVIMQCTGLKDKSGRDIYEGDIVRHISIRSKEKYCVCWKEDSASFYIKPLKGQGGYALFRSSEGYFPYEVIGNIYENPELLTTHSQDESKKGDKYANRVLLQKTQGRYYPQYE